MIVTTWNNISFFDHSFFVYIDILNSSLIVKKKKKRKKKKKKKEKYFSDILT